jgi:cobalt-zinc-cadmium efflux system protein
MFVEIIGAFVSGSLSLLADAGHMFADILALSIAIIAAKIAKRPHNASHTYGFRRAEVVAAFLNGILLVILALSIAFEAFSRLNHPIKIESNVMLLVAFVGLLVNLLGIAILKKDSTKNINIKGAFFHVISDLLSSVAVISTAIFISFFGNAWMDSFISIFISGLIIYSGYKLLSWSLHILMEGAPSNINVKEISKLIMKIPGVVQVHDIHAWAVSTGANNLSCHIKIASHSDCQPILKEIQQLLNLSYGIGHSTIQIEHCLSADEYICEHC